MVELERIRQNVAARELALSVLELASDSVGELSDDGRRRFWELLRDAADGRLPEGSRMIDRVGELESSRAELVAARRLALHQSSRSQRSVVVNLDAVVVRYTERGVCLGVDGSERWFPRAHVRFPDAGSKSGLPACGQRVSQVELPEWLAYNSDLEYERPDG